MTIHVEPQMAVKMANGIATSRKRSPGSCALLNSPPARSSQPGERRDELVDGPQVGIPARDEANLARPPFIEIEPQRTQFCRFRIADAEKHLIGLDRVDQAIGRRLSQLCRGG